MRGKTLAPWALALGLVALLAFTQTSDPDLGFHLATGREVLATGHIPRTNVLSFTEPQHPWVLHYWLPATLLELASRRAGALGLMAIKLPLITATWGLVLSAALRLGASPSVAAAVTLWGAWAASFRFSERPLIFSNLFLALLAYLLVRASIEPDARRRRALMASAALVSSLACHFHAGALFLFVLLGALALGCALEPLRARYFGALAGTSESRARASALVLAAAAGLALAALSLSLYHPFGPAGLTVPFTMERDSFLTESLLELRPTWRFPLADHAPFWGLLSAVVLAVILAPRRVPAPWSVASAVFAALAWQHVRFVDAFALLSAPLLAARLSELLSAVAASARGRVQALALVCVCVCAPFDHLTVFRFGVGVDRRLWPSDLFAFVQREGLRGPAFVSDGWAGLWLGAFYPRERAFFDNRFEAYSPRFYRDGYLNTRDGAPGWRAALDRYGVTLAVLKYTSPNERARQRSAPNLRQRLAHDPPWALVYFDDMGEVFVRRASLAPDALERLEIPGVDPDLGAMQLDDPRARAALLRALPRMPRSARAAAFVRALRPR